MDFHTLPRRELQTLCKRNKIPANMTNLAMADALQALPTVEGLEDLIQEPQQSLSPKKAAGMPEAPSRSCPRTSTRKQPNPPGSSVTRTRRAAAGMAGKNEAAAEKEDGGEDDVVVSRVGIPNSPTTLSSRGRKTRTLITAGCVETEEEEVEAVKKVELLPLEIPKTPATRATRGRRAANQVAKVEAEEVAKKQEEEGAPAGPQTPGSTTARRASTRRGRANAAQAPEEASGARSTRYRTRRAVVKEAAETGTAARTRTTAASRKNCRKATGVLPADVSSAGEDGAGGEAPADEGVVEGLIPVAVAGGAGAETEQAALSAEPTAEISLPIPEVDGSDGLLVDQTVEKAPTDGPMVEPDGSQGVHQTAAEGTLSDDPTVVDEDVPAGGSIDQTMNKPEEPADQTVEVEESRDSTVGDAPSDDRGVVEESGGSFDQTAVEELLLHIAEISLDPTVDEEQIAIAACSNDQTADDGRDLVEHLLKEGMLVEMEGRVDPTVQEIQVSIVDYYEGNIDLTVEGGDEISAREETFPEETAMVIATSEVGDPDAAGVPASVVTGAVAEGGIQVLPQETKEEEAEKEENAAPGLVSAVGEIIPVEREEQGEEEEEEETPPMVTPEVGDAVFDGVPASLVTDVVAAGGIQLLPQETGEEEAEKEENAAPGLVSVVGEIPVAGEEQGEEEKKDEETSGLLSMNGPLAETEKAADLVRRSMGGNAAPFLLGEQDKENTAVKTCLQHQQMAVVKYDNTTSLRKLKVAYKEALEEKKKRAALATLDDNCCITSQLF